MLKRAYPRTDYLLCGNVFKRNNEFGKVQPGNEPNLREPPYYFPPFETTNERRPAKYTNTIESLFFYLDNNSLKIADRS